MVVLSFLKNELSDPPLSVTPMSKQLQDVLWSPFGWDRIDNLTEKAQQALAACMARLAPFGACRSQHPRLNRDQIHMELRDGDPPGVLRCQPRSAIEATARLKAAVSIT